MTRTGEPAVRSAVRRGHPTSPSRHRALAVLVSVSLTTSPASCASGSPAEPLDGATRLAVIGDFGAASPAERAVAGAVHGLARQDGLDALVTTGDNIYPNGEPEHYDDAWHEPYGWTADEGVPVVAALGNHDVRRGHADSVMALLGMPERWYTRVVGNVELVVLDSTQVDDAAQLSFFEGALAADKPAGTEFRAVVLHHPPHSCSFHGGSEAVVDAWLPLIVDGDVELVLSGHEHVYQRFSDRAGPAYVVTGGGGAPLHRMRDCAPGTPRPDDSAEQHHYVLIEATDTTLRLQSLTARGRLLDTVVLQASRPSG